MSALTSFFLVLVAIGVALIGVARQKRYPFLGRVAGGLTISYIVVVLMLVGGEVYMRYGYDSSRIEFGMYGAIRGGNWEKRYIQRNSLDYRDREWSLEDLSSRQTIFAIGDSFTEGWGVKNPKDRYTAVLQNLLGDDYAVVVIAKAGYDTPEHQRDFEAYPYQTPDVVIWQYFLNDIDRVAQNNGMKQEFAIPPMPPIAKESYLASFMYWRLNNNRIYQIGGGPTGWAYHYAAYDNAVIWEAHKQALKRLKETIEATGARLIVVMFPDMSDPLTSAPYLDRVEQAFNELGVTDLLKLTDEANSWALVDRIVAMDDAHASASFNQRVGQMLYDQFFAEK